MKDILGAAKAAAIVMGAVVTLVKTAVELIDEVAQAVDG